MSRRVLRAVPRFVRNSRSHNVSRQRVNDDRGYAHDNTITVIILKNTSVLPRFFCYGSKNCDNYGEIDTIQTGAMTRTDIEVGNKKQNQNTDVPKV